MSTLADRLRARLEAKGIKGVRAAAKATGVGYATMADILADRLTDPKRDTLEKLAAGVGCTVGELLGETPPPAAAPAGDPANAVRAAGIEPGDVRLIPHSAIRPSPLNPRKRFDPEKLAELAESIRAEGILQNLVARPHPTEPGAWEIAAGERRWRAVALLIEQGARPADDPLPCRVLAIDDLGLLTIAMSENVQRGDMHPLEEGEGYAALIERGAVSTADIARRIGVTQRLVQYRVALATKLCPEAKAAFMDGRIILETARALTLGDAKAQRAILKAAGGRDPTAHQVRYQLTQKLIPTSHAIFDATLYTGAYVGEDDAPAEQRWFADVDQFRELQAAAVDALEEKLKKRWAWVERRQGYPGDLWQYGRDKKHAEAGAAILIHPSGKVDVLKGLVRPQRRAAEDGKAAAKPVEPYLVDHQGEAKRRKTAALQTAIAASPMTAMRLVCLALMGGRHAVMIQPKEREGQYDEVLAAPVARTLESFLFLTPCAASADDAVHDGEEGADDDPAAGEDSASAEPGSELRVRAGSERPLAFLNRHGMAGHIEPHEEAEAWRRLAALDDAAVPHLFAALVAAQTGSWNGWRPKLGDNAAVRAIADALGVTAGGNETGDGPFELTEDWLKGYRRPALLAAARSLGLRVEDCWTAARLRSAILKHDKEGRRAWTPPELTFAPGDRIEAYVVAGESGSETLATADRPHAGGGDEQTDLEDTIAERTARRLATPLTATSEAVGEA